MSNTAQTLARVAELQRCLTRTALLRLAQQLPHVRQIST